MNNDAHDTLITAPDGALIAHGREGCTGPNAKCKRAAKRGLMYHIIPHHLDPRAEFAHLALPTYHYASRDEAVEALNKGWETAITVDNAIDRDAAYKRRVPVKILKSGKYV